MAANKIIKAQMKQRRDTKANWAAQNPVLLAGELGIVSDDPNLYKVGDGTTAWNALPFRGFDGTLVHTTGDSETAVMSQKGVTEELAKLSAKVGHLYGEPTPAVLYMAQRGWVESNGKVVFDSSTFRSVSSYAPLQISENMPYSLIVSTSGTATKSFYIADSEDNILFTGPDRIPQSTITGVAPTGAAKIYINSAITPTIVIGCNIITELAGVKSSLAGVKSSLAATAETGVRELTHVSRYFPEGFVLSEGEIIYFSLTNEFCRGTSGGYEVIAPSAGSLWKFKGIILEYTGTGMSIMRGEVVKISYFSDTQPSGMTAGDFYYNTDQKVLYLFEFSYNSIPVIFSYSALYSYNGNIYFYDGNGLYPFNLGDYFDRDEPIFAPSPQLPANAESGSDFNCETVTSSDLHTALDALINSLQAPESGVYYTPKFLTKYDVSGLDASGVYPIYTYEMGLKNRYAWRASNELYAWKNGETIVYVDSCSPHIGDSIYSDANRTPSGKTVASYNSTTQTMTSSDSVNYTRDNASNVAANMIWLKNRINRSATAGTTYTAFNRADTSIGTATLVDSTHITFGGKTYERAECFDYHTDQMFTLFIWGNEHGPTSDPLEPSVILYRLAKDLAGGCRDNKFLAFLKHYGKIVFIPCANPWGCQYPRVVGRHNSNGVNINRNYDTVGWAAQADSDKGSYAGSEAETQYIMNMCKRFGADISIDIHCLGFGNVLAEGLMYFSETEIPDSAFYAKTQKVLGGFGYLFDHRGDPEPANAAHASEWMVQNGMIGGVFEMNPGKYSENHIYDGNQHTADVMVACYTEMLLCVRAWMAKVNPAFTFL